MIQQFRCAPQADPSRILTSLQWKALRLLSDAWLAAQEEGRDVWQFSLEIDELLELGLSRTEIRRLLCRDYLQHAEERTTERNSQRIFRPLTALVLPKRTCFVLTAKGREVISKPHSETAEAADASTGGPRVNRRFIPKVPRWDGASRQLWWGKKLVKKFHRPAVNQELVLAALEEEGWPPHVDDPLPRTGEIEPKTRLHDTIKALNRHQPLPIIRFSSTGNGRAIRWSLLKRD